MCITCYLSSDSVNSNLISAARVNLPIHISVLPGMSYIYRGNWWGRSAVSTCRVVRQWCLFSMRLVIGFMESDVTPYLWRETEEDGRKCKDWLAGWLKCNFSETKFCFMSSSKQRLVGGYKYQFFLEMSRHDFLSNYVVTFLTSNCNCKSVHTFSRFTDDI